MKHAVIDTQGYAAAFYDSDIHGDTIPSEAIPITDEQWREMIDNPGRRKFTNGEVVAFDPPPPLPTIDDYRRAIQSHVDATAQSHNYDSGITCASYVGSTNPAWAAEAAAFVGWRDAVWAYAFTELEKVQNGQRAQPTVLEIVGELPAIDWPAQ